MQTIRCAACGRRYDYRQEGCCPRCGAYNRPPRREWVGADGPYTTGRDVHRPGSAPVRYAMRKRYAFEEQTRKPRKKAAAPTVQGNERVVKSFQKPFKKSTPPRGKREIEAQRPR